jgi:hypothetical protein
MGILAISVIHLIYPDVGNWWADQLQQAQHMAESLQKKIATTAAVAPSNKISPLVASDAADVINVTKEYATGLITSAILCSALCQLILARWWQAAIFAPGRLRRELHSIRLSPLAGVLFIVSLVLFYLGNSVVLDIMPVLYMLFGAAGLSTIHYLFRLAYSSLTWFWMLLFYIALIISMPVGLMLITILALLDIWLDFRKRFKKA